MSHPIGILASVVGLLFAVLLELGEELWSDIVSYSLGGRAADPAISALIYIFLGSFIGLFSAGCLPSQFFAKYPLSGASLVLAPAGVGSAMHWFGAWLDRRGKDSPWLVTFWGGALFAFGIVLMRWIFIKTSSP